MNGLAIFRLILITVLFLVTASPLFAGFEACESLILNMAEDNRHQVKNRFSFFNKEDPPGSLLDIQKRSTKRSARRHNEKVISSLDKPLLIEERGFVNEITWAQAEELYRVEAEHPVVGGKVMSKYDPTGCTGYCFGRAIIVHFEAISRGIHPSAIRKIWAVGPAKTGPDGNGQWDYHVATVVKAKGKDGWLVIDTKLFPIPMPIKDWMQERLTTTKDDRLMFFVTDARRFTPYTNQKYSTADLLNNGNQLTDFYKGYFRDYLEYLSSQPRPPQFVQSLDGAN